MVRIDYLFPLLLIGGLYLMIHVIHWPGGHFP
jgi:hypothetical protein